MQVLVVKCHQNYQQNAVIHSVKQSFNGNQHSIWTIRQNWCYKTPKCFVYFHHTSPHTQIPSFYVYFFPSNREKCWSWMNIHARTYISMTKMHRNSNVHTNSTFGLVAWYRKLLYEITMHWNQIELNRTEPSRPSQLQTNTHISEYTPSWCTHKVKER